MSKNSRPVGASSKGRSRTSRKSKPAREPNPPQKAVDVPVNAVPESFQTVPSTSVSGEQTMNLTYRATKKNVVLYSIDGGPKGSVRFLTSQFAGHPPASIPIPDGTFAVKVAKVKLTKEERAALPKPTLAEKIEKRRAALAKMEAKAAQDLVGV